MKYITAENRAGFMWQECWYEAYLERDTTGGNKQECPQLMTPFFHVIIDQTSKLFIHSSEKTS